MTERAAAREHPDPSPRLIAIIVACAMFMAQLDGAVVALALPTMARSFGILPVQLTLGITVYLLVQVILLPTGSWISDRLGARNIFAAAIAVFTAASVLCAVSRSLTPFIVARVLQGSAAALMAPVGRIVLLESTPKRDLIGIMTITTVPMLIAPTLGPAIGGFITTYWSWPWIFLINVPFGLCGVFFALRFIPPSSRRQRRPFDYLGFLLFAGSSTLILYALQWLSDVYPKWPLPSLLMSAGLLLGYLALRHAQRHPHPIVSLVAIRQPSFAIAALRGGSLIRLSIRSLPYLLPMMFQLTFGFDAMQAGVLLLALNGGDLALKFITTRTLRRFGFRTILLVTTGLSALTMALCSLLTATTPYAVIFGLLFLSGMVRSLLFTGLSTLVFADVPHEQISSASILWNLVQQVTNVLGVSLAALSLAISAQWWGEMQGQLSVRDFHVALLTMAAVSFTALSSLRRLSPDAGASISGHRGAEPQETPP